MGTFISLTNINFINDYSGFITGTGGRIYKTSNSGTNWYSQTSGTNNILNSTFLKIRLQDMQREITEQFLRLLPGEIYLQV
ncbi:MAG: hypothetical protein IPG78_15515 [Ignavibacteria bacterium]|nr:hypothetical protein [Ignavibacteria bacterium]